MLKYGSKGMIRPGFGKHRDCNYKSEKSASRRPVSMSFQNNFYVLISAFSFQKTLRYVQGIVVISLFCNSD
jgi:hypothetical protein